MVAFVPQKWGKINPFGCPYIRSTVYLLDLGDLTDRQQVQ